MLKKSLLITTVLVAAVLIFPQEAMGQSLLDIFNQQYFVVTQSLYASFAPDKYIDIVGGKYVVSIGKTILTATVNSTSTAKGTIHYFIDCGMPTNNIILDKTLIPDPISLTGNLDTNGNSILSQSVECIYDTPPDVNYTAKAKVERGTADPVNISITLNVVGSVNPQVFGATASISATEVSPGNALVKWNMESPAFSADWISYLLHGGVSNTCSLTRSWDPALMPVAKSGETNLTLSPGAYWVKIGCQFRLGGSVVSNRADFNIGHTGTEESLYVRLTTDATRIEQREGVFFKAEVFGTAQGTVNYKFYCDDNLDRSFNSISNNIRLYWGCESLQPGSHTAKVVVERGNAKPAEAKLPITVSTESAGGVPIAGAALSVGTAVEAGVARVAITRGLTELGVSAVENIPVIRYVTIAWFMGYALTPEASIPMPIPVMYTDAGPRVLTEPADYTVSFNNLYPNDVAYLGCQTFRENLQLLSSVGASGGPYTGTWTAGSWNYGVVCKAKDDPNTWQNILRFIGWQQAPPQTYPATALGVNVLKPPTCQELGNCPSPRYSCNLTYGACVLDPNGPYTSLESCTAACKSPSPRYSCDLTYGCVIDPNGPYSSLDSCTAACKSPSELKVDIKGR